MKEVEMSPHIQWVAQSERIGYSGFNNLPSWLTVHMIGDLPNPEVKPRFIACIRSLRIRDEKFVSPFKMSIEADVEEIELEFDTKFDELRWTNPSLPPTWLPWVSQIVREIIKQHLFDIDKKAEPAITP